MTPREKRTVCQVVSGVCVPECQSGCKLLHNSFVIMM